MASNKTPIATDSAAELHTLVGDDATATFENDPKFIDSDSISNASSENVEEQRDTDDMEESDEEIEDEEDLEDDEDDDDAEEDDEDFDDDAEEDDEEEVGATAGA